MTRAVSLSSAVWCALRLWAVALLLLVALPAAADTRRALVIGINAYEKIPTLEKAVNDATAVGAQLRAAGFVTEVLLDAGGTQVVASLERLTASVEPGDEVIFYFAGHGVEIEGQNYLLPADVALPVGGGELAIRRQSLPVAEVTDALERQGARVSLLILDACRDNPFARQGTRSVGTRRGLARMVAPEGTFIMYSAGEGQSALDSLGPDDANPNSVFTRALLPKLSTPGMRLRDMAVDVRSEVIQLARGVGHNQFPAVYDQLDGRFEVTPAALASVADDDAEGVAVATDSDTGSGMTDGADPVGPDLAATGPSGASLGDPSASTAGAAEPGPALSDVAPSEGSVPRISEPDASVPDAAELEVAALLPSPESSETRQPVNPSEAPDASRTSGDAPPSAESTAASPDQMARVDTTEEGPPEPDVTAGPAAPGPRAERSGPAAPGADAAATVVGADAGTPEAPTGDTIALLAPAPSDATPSATDAPEAGPSETTHAGSAQPEVQPGACVRERSIWRGLRVLDDAAALESFSDTLPPACQEIAQDVLERLVEITVSAKDTCRARSEALTPRAGQASVQISSFDIAFETAAAACGALASAFETDAEAQGVYGTFLMRASEGFAAVRRQDPMPNRFETAATLLSHAAARGDAAAMTQLGVLHLSGRGVDRDYVAALDLFRDAAAAGETQAMMLIGILHQDGLGVARDAAEAVTWFRRGAEAGDADAMTLMGWMALEGSGVPRDADVAYRWFRQAADAGSSDAMALLASSYLHGRGLPQNDETALLWYGRAAEAGNASAMNWMGWFHRHGRGVPRNDRMAVEWYARAADAGNAEAMASAAWHASRGLGTQVDPTAAAELYTRAVRFGMAPETLATILTQEAAETLVGVQARLRELGAFEGPVTGVFDPQTRAALAAYAGR